MCTISLEVQSCYFNRNVPCFSSDGPRLLLLHFGHKPDLKNYTPTLIKSAGPLSVHLLSIALPFLQSLIRSIYTIHFIRRSNDYRTSLNHPSACHNFIALSTNPSPLRLAIWSCPLIISIRRILCTISSILPWLNLCCLTNILTVNPDHPTAPYPTVTQGGNCWPC